MSQAPRISLLFALMALLITLVGQLQSWSVALSILNLCLISAIMALGVNMQWGYAGLFNVGIMGFAALGGLAGVLVSKAPVPEAWAAGGLDLGLAALVLAVTITVILVIRRGLPANRWRTALVSAVVIAGLIVYRWFFDPAVAAIESTDPSRTGYLGGLNLPILLAWPLGAVLAAGAAWMVGKVSLGLRSDYLAIATLGIAEIIIAVLKNEDWLARGVKNVTGLPRPVPYETDLYGAPWFIDLATRYGLDPVQAASLAVKLSYAVLFTLVLIVVFVLAQRALNSPWGRMMRAIRDNVDAAHAMGKDVTHRHLQIFIVGSAVVGLAGAMLTTLDGQFTPTTYQPLRYTFLIWVMVIVGGSGNNWGAVLGGFLIWFIWIEAEPVGLWLIQQISSGMAPDSLVRAHLLEKRTPHADDLHGPAAVACDAFQPAGLDP